jgi:hypothetical protein
MFAVGIGAIMVVGSSGFFWYLLPRHGQVNPLVRNSDVGSMVTIAIMSVLTLGIAILWGGLAG